MKLKDRKRAILKETAIFSAIAMVLGGGYYFVDMKYSELDTKAKALEADASRLLSERNTLQSRIQKFQQNIELFKEVQAKMGDSGLYIDRAAVWDILNIYKTRFFLSSLSADMQGIAELKDDPKFVRPTFVALATDVVIKFDAPSDIEVYDMMDAMQKELSGYTKITALSFTKKDEVGVPTLEAIVKQGSAANVAGSISFRWYGLKAQDPNSDANKYIPVKKRARQRRVQ
jgi:hypothetical protein